MNVKGKVFGLFERYTKWTDYLFVILTVFTCTFFVYRDFGIRMILGYAALVGILAIHLLRRIAYRRSLGSSPFKEAYFLIAFFILVYFLFPVSRHDEDTIAYMISMLVCFGYLLCAFPSEKEIKLCEKIVLVAGGLFALFIMFFCLFPDLYWKTVYKIVSEPSQELASYYIPRGYGVPIGGSYTFADYVMTLAALLVCGHALSRNESRKKRIISLALVFFFLLAILLVGRRGELIAAVVTLAIVALLFSRIKLNKRTWWIILGVAATFVLLVVCLWPVLEKIPFLYRYIRTFEKLLSGGDITSGRLELWNMAWLLFLKKPIFGIGWGGFAAHVSEDFRAIHGQDVMDVHNTYLQLLCETGIVGTILIMVPIIFCLVQTVRQVRRLRKEPEDRTLLITMSTTSLGIQIFFLVLGLLDPCFYKLIYWAFYAIALLLLVMALKMEGKEVPGFSQVIRSRLAERGKKE